MTVVLGQQFFNAVAIIADSRVSVGDKPWADNAQKVYFLNENIIIGFAGDINIAGILISFLAQTMQRYPNFGVLRIFKTKVKEILNIAYEQLQEQHKGRTVSFIVAGMDQNDRNIVNDQSGGPITDRLSPFIKTIIMKMSSEQSFEPTFSSMQTPSLIIGSGEEGLENLRENFFQLSLDTISIPVHQLIGVLDLSLRAEIKKLKINTVGGLSQIAVIDEHGARYVPYKSVKSITEKESWVEMIIKKDRLVQKDYSTGKEIPLLFPHEIVSLPNNIGELLASSKVLGLLSE